MPWRAVARFCTFVVFRATWVVASGQAQHAFVPNSQTGYLKRLLKTIDLMALFGNLAHVSHTASPVVSSSVPRNPATSQSPT